MGTEPATASEGLGGISWGLGAGRTAQNHMGGCQNYGPFLGTLNLRCRIIIRVQKGAIILTTTHMSNLASPYKVPTSSIVPLE